MRSRKRKVNDDLDTRRRGIDPPSNQNLSITVLEAQRERSVYHSPASSQDVSKQQQPLQFVSDSKSQMRKLDRNQIAKRTASIRAKVRRTTQTVRPSSPQQDGKSRDLWSLPGNYISGSATGLYGVVDSNVSSFQDLLSYCMLRPLPSSFVQLTGEDPVRVGHAFYPLEGHVPFQFNPIQSVWLPLALTDEVLLHAILYATALHLWRATSGDSSRDVSTLTNIVFNGINRRLADNKLSDATVGAVSCLAMVEVRLLMPCR